MEGRPLRPPAGGGKPLPYLACFFPTSHFGGRIVKAEVSSSILEPTELPQTEQR